MDLNGKVAFVTGGSGDIGKAIALALAASGTDVAVSYVGEAARAEAVVEAVRKAGRQGHAVQLDQRDPKSIERCVEKVISHFGRIDILVNNAAWNIGIPFAELDALTAEIWDRVLETNLRGPFLLSRAFASGLRRHKTGRIINIASLAGLAPGRQQHRLCGKQSGTDPSHSLLGRRTGTGCDRELHSARAGRGNAHGRAAATGSEGGGPHSVSPRTNGERR